MIPDWEYKVTSETFDEARLNSFGYDGWELVTVDHFQGSITGLEGPCVCWAVFKRQRVYDS